MSFIIHYLLIILAFDAMCVPASTCLTDCLSNQVTDYIRSGRPIFEVLTAVSMKMAVFWVVAPCSLVEVYQRFVARLTHHPDDGGRKDL
jgi:hypothetical protein